MKYVEQLEKLIPLVLCFSNLNLLKLFRARSLTNLYSPILKKAAQDFLYSAAKT